MWSNYGIRRCKKVIVVLSYSMNLIDKLTVSIVVPNWNGEALLLKNLPSVIAAAKNAQIIVTDDASTDDSLAMLKDKFPEVIVVANLKRQGFAGNVNSGVSQATGDVIILLNTDVRPTENFLYPLLSYFIDPTVFAVGCLEQSRENNHIVERGRGLARWEKGYFIHSKGRTKEGSTAWVSGGSGAYRRSIWNSIGGMDTLYNPFYWEDIDISYTARKAGYRTIFEPKSVVEHFHEEGKIKMNFSANNVKLIAYRNQYFFIWKNLSDFRILSLHIVWTPVRLLQAVFRRDYMMIMGFLNALFQLPRILLSRRKAKRLWKRADGELSILV